jgi:hypothetical protein
MWCFKCEHDQHALQTQVEDDRKMGFKLVIHTWANMGSLILYYIGLYIKTII